MKPFRKPRGTPLRRCSVAELEPEPKRERHLEYGCAGEILWGGVIKPFSAICGHPGSLTFATHALKVGDPV